MTLLRMIVIFVGALVLLLSVVVLRAQTSRLHYEIARCQRQTEELQQELIDAELELARLRSPTRLRQRAEEAIEELAAEQGEGDPAQRGAAGAAERER